MRRLLLIVSIILAGQGLAQADERSDSLTAKGNSLAKLGDFHGALTMFKQALARSPGANERCNVGGAYYKLQRWAEAYLYLDLCVRAPVMQSDPVYLKAMTDVFKKVEKNVANGEFALVSFEVEPQNARLQVSALPGDVYFSAQQKLWLPTGIHSVSAKAIGFEAKASEVRVLKGDRSTIRIVLSEKAVVTPVEPNVKEPGGGGAGTTEPRLLPQSGNPADSSLLVENPSKPSRGPAIAALSVGAVSLTGGVAYYFLASNAADKAADLPASDPKRDGLQDQFKTRRIVSYSLLGVGAIATILGTYWILGSDSDGDSRTSFRANISQDGAQFSGSWRF